MKLHTIISIYFIFTCLTIGCAKRSETELFITVRSLDEQTKEPLHHKKFILRIITKPLLTSQGHYKIFEGFTDEMGEFSFRADKSRSYVVELYEKEYLIGGAEFEADDLKHGEVKEFLFEAEPPGGHKKKNLDSLKRL